MGSNAVILLDTHVLVWSSVPDSRLGSQARELIAGCSAGDPFYVSAISAWEIALQVKKGRIDFGMPAAKWFDKASRHPAWRTIPLDAATAMESADLPGDVHGDPADRFLIALARSAGLHILTADRNILAYAKSGHVLAYNAEK